MPEKNITMPTLCHAFGMLLDRLIQQHQMPGEEDFPKSYVDFRETIAASSLPIARLCGSLHTTPFEEMMLFAAIAPIYQKKYGDFFAKENGNSRERYPTPRLLSVLLRPIYSISFAELYSFTLPYHRLSFLWEQVPLARRGLDMPLRPRQSFVRFLFDIAVPGDILLPAIQQFSAGCPLEPVANQAELQAALMFVQNKLQAVDEAPGLLVVDAGAGGGKDFCLHYIAGALGLEIAALDGELLLQASPEDREELLSEYICYCRLFGILPAIRKLRCGLPALSEPGKWEEILQRLTEHAKLVIVSGESASLLSVPAAMQPYFCRLEPFSGSEQQRFWELCSGALQLPAAKDVSFENISKLYELSPGQIERVLYGAEAIAKAQENDCYDQRMLLSAMHQAALPALSAVAKRMESSFTMTDLFLAPEAMAAVKEVCSSVKAGREVREKWGFCRLLPYGRGTSVLLYGPSGTGKSMTAQVIANELGMDLYRIDLSQVMDKYIGETEKKLGAIFDAAQSTNAILFFDEADALFSKRTDVHDSKDKYANVETAYLLQKMEEYHGISIMATNIGGNFDPAFKRRIHHMIHIDIPDQEIRLQLWEHAFPAAAPVNRTGFPRYAECLKLTGSNIKNIAVAAACLAMAAGTSIETEHLMAAIKQEYEKVGQLFSPADLY